MHKAVDFLVEKRVAIFSIMVVLAIACGVAMNFVNINADLTKYLPADSDMKQGIDIMEEQFPETEGVESFKIMFEDLSYEEKLSIYTELTEFEGVESVTYDVNSELYNKDNFTLYLINTTYSDESKTEALIDNIVSEYENNYEVSYYWENAPDTLLSFLIPIALVILLTVLIIMSRSYFEPVLLIITIGIAIILNMGSNIIFPSVSDMTFSIAAVLQLVLSIDYSIILMHRYAQEKELLGPDPDIKLAMKNTLHNTFKSITSSSLTTFVGLLALLFMTFTIGMDMGLVLAKGVLLSLVCIFTVLPALVIWSDKLIEKTSKKHIREKRLMKREVRENAQ